MAAPAASSKPSVWTRWTGSGAAAKPKPTLQGQVTANQEYVAGLEVQAKKLQEECDSLMKRIREAPYDKMAKKRWMAKRRALDDLSNRIISREQQVMSLQTNQAVQLDADNLKANAVVFQDTEKTMRATMKQLQKMDFDNIADTIADHKAAIEEMQEAMNYSYDLDNELTDADLEEEMEAMAAGMANSESYGVGMSMPDFGQEEMPTFIDEPPDASKVKETAA